jgi:GNAT superfamily N-acetyltransferase
VQGESGARPARPPHSKELPVSVNLPITLRPAGPDDNPFLIEVYSSTRAEEMALVPWNSEQQMAFVSAQFQAQQEHYLKKYPAAQHDIVLSGDRPIGRLYVARLDQEIRIVDILLLPSERNAGIGSFLLKRLLHEGRSTGKPVRIYVESFNRSLALFLRLGFVQIEQHGIHLLMEWSEKNQVT